MSQGQDFAFPVQVLEEQVGGADTAAPRIGVEGSSVGVASYTLVFRPPSPARSEAVFAGGRSVSSVGDCNGLAAEIPPVPDHLVRSCAALTGEGSEGEEGLSRSTFTSKRSPSSDHQPAGINSAGAGQDAGSYLRSDYEPSTSRLAVSGVYEHAGLRKVGWASSEDKDLRPTIWWPSRGFQPQ